MQWQPRELQARNELFRCLLHTTKLPIIDCHLLLCVDETQHIFSSVQKNSLEIQVDLLTDLSNALFKYWLFIYLFIYLFIQIIYVTIVSYNNIWYCDSCI